MRYWSRVNFFDLQLFAASFYIASLVSLVFEKSLDLCVAFPRKLSLYCMENFSPESLKKFLQGHGPSQEARTKRGQRISNIMRTRADTAKADSANLDGMIRQSMGELVRKYMQANKHQELQSVLYEHKQFIEDILKLLDTAKKRS